MEHHFRDACQGGADNGKPAGHGFQNDGGQNVGGAFPIRQAGEGEDVRNGQFLLDFLLAEDAAEGDMRLELEAVDLSFEGGTLRAFADDLQGGGNVIIAQGGDGVDEDGEAFEIDQAADADQVEGRWRGAGVIGTQREPHAPRGGLWELAGIDAVVDAVDAVRGVRTEVDEEGPAIVADGGGEDGFADHLPQEIVIGQIDHEVLGVGREAVGEAGFFEEKGGVGGAVGEMNVNVRDTAFFEFAGEVPGVPGADVGLVGFAVSGPVLIRQGSHGMPDGILRWICQGEIKHRGRRRINHLGPQPGKAFMAEAVGRGIQTADDQFMPGGFKGQHLRIAERL